jgi:hypothetical protein
MILNELQSYQLLGSNLFYSSEAQINLVGIKILLVGSHYLTFIHVKILTCTNIFNIGKQ